MEFQFSFGKKQERILVNKKPHIHHVGALIQSVLDIDWNSLKGQMELWELGEIPSVCWENTLVRILKAADCHPVICAWLCDGIKQNIVIKKRIEGLIEMREQIQRLTESLVDEEQHDYIIRFYELFPDCNRYQKEVRLADQGTIDCKIHGQQSEGSELDRTENQMHFQSNSLECIVYNELKYFCKNRFFVRKCACCRRFFWTNFTNKVYCNRSVPGRTRTCSQYGPSRTRQKKKRPAYNLYWERRAQVFHLALQQKDHIAFRTWVKATQPYKERARQETITVEEMASSLGRIERRLFPSLL